jgi:tRNA(fMet)-specific endonuclease VapC
MKYLLDTNVCIRYINGRAPQLVVKLRTMPRKDVAVSAITKAEMFYGSAQSRIPIESRKEQIEFLETLQPLAFDDNAASAYGPMRAELERSGTPIGQHDMLIVAIGLANGLILVTHNTQEFARAKGLQVEDWEL